MPSRSPAPRSISGLSLLLALALAAPARAAPPEAPQRVKVKPLSPYRLEISWKETPGTQAIRVEERLAEGQDRFAAGGSGAAEAEGRTGPGARSTGDRFVERFRLNPGHARIELGGLEPGSAHTLRVVALGPWGRAESEPAEGRTAPYKDVTEPGMRSCTDLSRAVKLFEHKDLGCEKAIVESFDTGHADFPLTFIRCPRLDCDHRGCYPPLFGTEGGCFHLLGNVSRRSTVSWPAGAARPVLRELERDERAHGAILTQELRGGKWVLIDEAPACAQPADQKGEDACQIAFEESAGPSDARLEIRALTSTIAELRLAKAGGAGETGLSSDDSPGFRADCRDGEGRLRVEHSDKSGRLVLTGLAPEARQVCIAVLDRDGRSTPPAELRTTPIPTAPPRAPDGLAIRALSPYRLELTWREPAGGAEQIIVQQRRGDQPAGGEGFFDRAHLLPGHLRLEDGALNPDEIYGYRIKAVNSRGSSPWSAAVTSQPLPYADSLEPGSPPACTNQAQALKAITRSREECGKPVVLPIDLRNEDRSYTLMHCPGSCGLPTCGATLFGTDAGCYRMLGELPARGQPQVFWFGDAHEPVLRTASLLGADQLAAVTQELHNSKLVEVDRAAVCFSPHTEEPEDTCLRLEPQGQ